MINDNPPNPVRRPRTRRRWLRWAVVLLLVLLIAAEFFCRFGLGLGDPPLLMTDASIEYLYQPGKTYRRFGNLIRINQWSMRSDNFPAVKSDPDELRVLVIGDSVINGGALTDQGDLATQRLQEELGRNLRRKVIVGNISAGSWGPANQLAYLKRFGTFDADVIVFVFSSHDASDDPEFDPNLADRPDFVNRKPPLALVELVQRYLLPRLRSGQPSGDPMGASTQPTRASLAAVAEAIDLALLHARVIVVEHYTTDELAKSQEPMGFQALDELISTRAVRVVKLRRSFSQPDAIGVYRDYIHPSAKGHALLAQTLLPVIEEQLRTSATRPQ